MPFFRFHCVDRERLAPVSGRMIDQIVEAVGCPREHIVLEVISSDYIFDGEIQAGWPFVEVSWFKRPLQQQDAVAKIVNNVLKEAGYANADVYFEYLEERNYYENGEHY